MDEEIERLYEELEKSSYTAAITGAGISISAGGPKGAGMDPGSGPGV